MNSSGLKRVRDQQVKEGEKRKFDVARLENGDTVVMDMDAGKVFSNIGGRAPLTGVSGSNIAWAGSEGLTGHLAEVFSLVNTGGTDKSRATNAANFNAAIARGDTTAAQRLVDNLALRSMPVASQNKFTQFGVIARAREELRALEDDFARTNPSLYKTVIESAKPWAAASTDPKWQQFVAKAQNTVNQYRNEIYGASLTGNELKSANVSLPNWDRDAFGTIVTKLNGMEDYALGVRESLLSDYVGNFGTSNAQTSTPTSSSEPLPGEDIFTSVVQPKSTGGYWSNLWEAITGRQ
jgi:hypothetical protein